MIDELLQVSDAKPSALDIFKAELDHKGRSEWKGGTIRHCYTLPAYQALYVEALCHEMDLKRSDVAAHLFAIALEAIEQVYGDDAAWDQVRVRFDQAIMAYSVGNRSFAEDVA